MNENQLTSLPLSKWLAERGFKGDYDYLHITQKKIKNGYFVDDESIIIHRTKRYGKHRVIAEHPAYDLIWDICIKYAEEIFGEEPTNSESGYLVPAYEVHHIQVFVLLFEGKKEEAEAYIIANSILK